MLREELVVCFGVVVMKFGHLKVLQIISHTSLPAMVIQFGLFGYYFKTILKWNFLFTHLPLKFNKISGSESSLNGPKSYFDCSHNYLTSLEGAPKEVGDHFYCEYNRLTSLRWCPEKIGGSFWCHENQLTSLEGIPRIISGDFNCRNNKIWTFEGAPEHITGYFDCCGNPIFNIWRLFQDYSKVELLNECDPIREIDGKQAVVLDRLNGFLEEIGKKPVEEIDGYINV